MATLFDGLAKDILDVMLGAYGELEREHVVPALTPQRGDVRYVPDPAHAAARRALGTLGRMTERACLFDPFHEAPSLDEVLACLRKLLNARHAGTLDARAVTEHSWLLCGGRPVTALSALRARPMRGWPAGFYELAPALGLSLVVLSELPQTDDTLPLRLMGAGATWGEALTELQTRYEHLPHGAALHEAVVETFLAARERGALPAEVSMLDLTRAREFIRTERLAGRVEGRVEALAPLVRLFARRLGRPLTDAERDTLSSRLDTLGGDRLGDVVLDLTPDELGAWLTDPDAR